MINKKIIEHSVLDSTNEEAKRYLESNNIAEDEVVIITTKQQTKGKGRLGRIWQCYDGNLFTSFIVKQKCEFNYFGQLSFIASLALRNVICKNVDQKHHLKIELKWPNDVLINNKKIAGILLETQSSNNQLANLIIGVGLNINSYPTENLRYDATCLHEYNNKINANEFSKQFYEIFTSYFSNWQRFGFDDFKLNWLKYAKNLNKKISIENSNTKVSGIFITISDIGEIVIRTSDNKLQKFASGEVT